MSNSQIRQRFSTRLPTISIRHSGNDFANHLIKKAGTNALEAEFRTVIQSAKRLSFAFLGSQASLLSEMFTVRRRPFFQAAKIIELGPIDRKSLKSYIRKRFRSASIKTFEKGYCVRMRMAITA